MIYVHGDYRSDALQTTFLGAYDQRRYLRNSDGGKINAANDDTTLGFKRLRA